VSIHMYRAVSFIALRGMQRGTMRDVMWDTTWDAMWDAIWDITWDTMRDTMWDGLYGENVVYKSAGNPSCLVFYLYRISSLFPVFTIRTREQVNQTGVHFY